MRGGSFGLCAMLGVLSWMRVFGSFAWIVLALYLSIYAPLSIWLTQRMRLPGWLVPLGFAFSWVGLEWLHSQSIFGFAWGELGSSQIDGFPRYCAALGSVYLISFLMLWGVGVLVASRIHRNAPRWWLWCTTGVVLVCMLGGWLQVSTSTTRQRASYDRKQVFTLMQPDVLEGLTPEALVKGISYDEYQHRMAVMTTLSQQAMRQGTIRRERNSQSTSATRYLAGERHPSTAFLCEYPCALPGHAQRLPDWRTSRWSAQFRVPVLTRGVGAGALR